MVVHPGSRGFDPQPVLLITKHHLSTINHQSLSTINIHRLHIQKRKICVPPFPPCAVMPIIRALVVLSVVIVVSSLAISSAISTTSAATTSSKRDSWHRHLFEAKERNRGYETGSSDVLLSTRSRRASCPFDHRTPERNVPAAIPKWNTCSDLLPPGLVALAKAAASKQG